MRPEQSRAARGLGRRSCWLDSSGLPAGKLLLTEPLQVSHDRVDDLPVLLELVCRLDLPILLDQCLGGRGLHQGLSNGWLAAVWLVYILSEGDHRKAEVQAWAEAHRPSLERLLGQSLRATEFNDDRLGIVLRRLAETAGWETLEAPLWRRTVAVHARWPPDQCERWLTEALARELVR